MPEKFKVITISGHQQFGDAHNIFSKELERVMEEGWQVLWGTYRLASSRGIVVHSVLVFKT